MAREVSLKPSIEEDREFLYRVYAGTRAEEMQHLPWTDEQKHEFLNMQFTMQDTQYRQHYSNARFDVILLDGKPVGRLYVDRCETEFRIIDIALLPEFCGKGIGTKLVTNLLEEASKAGKPVRIHVMQGNPAMKLYARLGFQKTGDQGIYDLMERKPA